MNISVASAVTGQVIVMAIYIALGYILTKLKTLSTIGTKQMTFILLNFVTPCVILSAFQECDRSAFGDLFVAFLVSIAIHVIGLVIIKLVYIKFESGENTVIDKFCSVYSNCGFMGIPLLSSALGAKGVFIGTAYLVVFNILVWTQGYREFNKANGTFSIKKAVLNPGVIALSLAAVVLAFNIRFGSAVNTVVNGLASLNTPVAMLLLGIYLGESKLGKAFSNPGLYIVCFFRLALLPFVAIVFMKLMKIDSSMAVALTLSAACPCGAISAIFAAEFGKDSGYASSVVSVSTIFSLVTLPVVAYIASMVFI